MAKIKFRKKYAIFLSMGVFLFFAIPFLSAQAQEVQEDLFHIPGTTEGAGKNFAITDSQYLNISLTSSEEITARIESAPETIILEIKASEEFSATNIVISGLSPNTTYHKYQDDYHNYAPLISDENGEAFFIQDISQDYIIFIQPRKSTKSIKNNIAGGDCGLIGIWNYSLKTCTLNQDIDGTIQIDSNNIILDGNGHTLTGDSTSHGIYVPNKINVTIRNITITRFSFGIYFYKSSNSKIISVKAESNLSSGIRLNSSSSNNLSNNTIVNNYSTGLSIESSRSNTISNNIVGPKNSIGISESNGNANFYENNDISNNRYGAMIACNYCTLFNNKIESNEYDGFSIVGGYNSLRRNFMSNNGRSNFSVSGSNMDTNDIDVSNMVEGKPIYYIKNESNKVYDSSFDIGVFYCASCENITLKDISLADKQTEIFLWHTNNSLIENVTSSDGNIRIKLYYSTNNTIRENTLNRIILYSYSNDNKIYNNNLVKGLSPISIDQSAGNLFNLDLPVGGNYWECNEADCADDNNDGICDDPYRFNGGVDNYPWAQKSGYNNPMPAGNSSVMFLPGIKASRLYKDGTLMEDQLWPPNYFGNDLEDLALNENGESINDVYTKDIIEEVGAPIIGGNIYKTFVGELESLRAGGVIDNYNLFAYDWRKNVEEVAQDGTLYFDGAMKSATTELKNLAENSQNKKVTIIAHSNGGLLAKAIMQELEKSGETGKVDKIVFVGTPQMGTPLAILSLLYGYDESMLFGTLISQSEARTLAENMPGAYGLLPSEKYFERIEEPFINFLSENTRYKDFKDIYAENIDSFAEFRKFLTGEGDGREKPEEDDTESENILRENLLDEAIETHQHLDEWTPPANVKVIEIAGWGLDTVSGVNYTEKEKMDCYAFPEFKIPSCIGIGEYEPVYEPQFTVDGDKVVVAPSALMLPEGENLEKYWVDLYRYNHDPIINKNKNHGNIFETNPIQQFLQKIISSEGVSSSLPEYIYNNRPEDFTNTKPRIRMSLYSPLDMHFYDSANRHTGPKTVTINGEERVIIEEGIPNSYYYQFGERKFVGFPTGENIQIVMDGYALGSYTLKLEEMKVTENGSEIVAHTTFANLPTTADATVSLNIPETGLAGMTTLEADMDSDGVNDYEIDKILNGTAVPVATIETISNNVDHLAKLGFIMDAKTQDFLQVKIRELAHVKDMIEKMDDKDNKNPQANQLKLLNKKIDDLIGFIRNKFSDSILPLARDLLIQNLNSIRM